ncbi:MULTISPECIES: LeuD/DmdB family oxidoreductase small subunit [Micromonospora]|uniref:3-isopropylmalate dehydratase small subunit n=1 Tax=Micromonospora yangpuensis TaxID=683228 RepID=A0A1C6UW25_9ACTN|nr:3-isopropylmalate dehydratase small subunit [Micromonospora yangpuensis]GGM25747.1 3-isopropylmalate dehydratase small subunit [Micromonospora yangpuensis]SCL58166.1 3-isopropylmalate dehydratase, small subunit [Micromonospora yangpuensis]
MSTLRGPVVRIGDDIDTDMMVPGAYLNVTDPVELAPHLLEAYDPAVTARIVPGCVLVAGRNLGMGSSREHAQLALRGRGVQAVVAESFARIFFRNCVNLGLPVVEHREAARALRDGGEVTVDLAAGLISADGQRWQIPPTPPFVADLVAAGGLVPWVRRRLGAS